MTMIISYSTEWQVVCQAGGGDASTGGIYRTSLSPGLLCSMILSFMVYVYWLRFTSSFAYLTPATPASLWAPLGWGPGLFCLLLNAQSLEQCLVHRALWQVLGRKVFRLIFGEVSGDWGARPKTPALPIQKGCSFMVLRSFNPETLIHLKS